MKPDDKRTRIINAAIKIFSCTGYAASNVPSIAKAANVSVGTIYHYLKNKQDILNVALQTTLANVNSELTTIFQDNESIEGSYNALFEASSLFIKNETITVHFLYGNLFNPDLDETSIQSRQETTKLLVDFLKKGQSKKVFIDSGLHTQLSLLIGSLFMLSNFYWLNENVPGESAPTMNEINHLKNQIWNGLTVSQAYF
ncbi:TetR/AcrR family transcriptional regulator [Lentilactobacillus diolivorans]|nr:TetR/AcrR family transcriptional regulator [Lentilactobacillus diolivorans]GEP24596.1 TetR family transcriptional regulator [Lentilactobacillus diolivorans]